MMSGQRRKKPELGLLKQAFEPPPQLGMPELPIREAPISKITVPERFISLSHDKNESKLTCHHGREDTLQNSRRYKRHKDFQERSNE